MMQDAEVCLDTHFQPTPGLKDGFWSIKKASVCGEDDDFNSLVLSFLRESQVSRSLQYKEAAALEGSNPRPLRLPPLPWLWDAG